MVNLEKDEGIQKIICSNCGAQVPMNRFCQHCGAPLQNPGNRPVSGSFGRESFNGYGQGDEQEPDWDNPYASPQSYNLMPPPMSSEGRENLITKIAGTWKVYSRTWAAGMVSFIIYIFALLFMLAINNHTDHADRTLEMATGTAMALSFFMFAIFGLISFIYALILLYRLWIVVPANIAATTPDRAVGFLFIPFFNIYWMFIAYYRLADHYDDLTRRMGDRRNHSVLAIARCVFQFIPYIGMIGGPICTFILYKFLKEDAIFILRTYPQTNPMPQPGYYPNPGEMMAGGMASNEGNPNDFGNSFNNNSAQNGFAASEEFQNQNPGNPSYFDQNQLGDQSYDKKYSLLIPINTSGWAIAAGYLGLFSLLIFPAPLALIFGLIALRDIRKNPKTFGKGRSWFAIIMGSLVMLGTAAMFIIGSLG